MTFVGALIVTVGACFVLRNPLLRHPGLFYGLAIVADIAFVATSYFAVPYGLWKIFFILILKCMVSVALFVVIMYIGCFKRTSKVSQWLRPIRAELSIVASILSLGHIAAYLGVYVPAILAGSAKSHVMAAFMVALLLLALLLILGYAVLRVFRAVVDRKAASDSQLFRAR